MLADGLCRNDNMLFCPWSGIAAAGRLRLVRADDKNVRVEEGAVVLEVAASSAESLNGFLEMGSTSPSAMPVAVAGSILGPRKSKSLPCNSGGSGCKCTTACKCPRVAYAIVGRTYVRRMNYHTHFNLRTHLRLRVVAAHMAKG